MVNRFVLNGLSYHGKGAINEIVGILTAKGFKKAFVASDPDLVKFQVTKKVTDLLDAAGFAYEIYSISVNLSLIIVFGIHCSSLSLDTRLP